jgi:hypothetical protein
MRMVLRLVLERKRSMITKRGLQKIIFEEKQKIIAERKSQVVIDLIDDLEEEIQRRIGVLRTHTDYNDEYSQREINTLVKTLVSTLEDSTRSEMG